MPARCRRTEQGAARGRAAVADIARTAREARVSHGLSQDDVAKALGISRSQYSRMERGLAPSLSVETACRLMAVLGHELSIRAYPSGEPLRDAAHTALLSALHDQLHAALRWQTEVALPHPGDRRAWDATIRGSGWRFGVEAETRPTDFQALDRRLALKERDGDVDGIILLLSDTRHNRRLVRLHREDLAGRYPVSSREALECLRAGRRLPGSAVILLPLRRGTSGR